MNTPQLGRAVRFGSGRLMARVLGRAVLTASLALSVIGAGTVQATHAQGGAGIGILRGGDVTVALYYGFADCSGTSCVVQVPMSNRDLRRMTSWCGGTTVTLVVDTQPGTTTDMQQCFGPSAWSIRIIANTYMDPNNFASHDTPVTVEVHAIRAN